MRFVAFLSMVATLILTSAAAQAAQVKAPPDGKKTGGPGAPPATPPGGFAIDPDKIFDTIAKGEDAIVIANLTGAFQSMLQQFADDNKITNGMITRKQFQEFGASMMKRIQDGGFGGAKGEPESPESIVRKYVLAIKQNRIEDSAKTMHPEALKQFRNMLLPALDIAAKDGEADQLLVLFGGLSLAELRKLDDLHFFTSFFRGLTKINPKFTQIFESAEIQTIGHVMEGKDTAHVVCRTTMSVDGVKVSTVMAISLQRTESGWGILLSGEMDGFANSLKKKYDGKR